MPVLTRRDPAGELEQTLARAADYRQRAAEQRTAAESDLASRDTLAGREAAGELAPDAAVAAYRDATSRAERAFEEAERLEAVAVELDGKADQLRGAVAAVEAAERRDAAEKANAKTVVQATRVASVARLLAGEVEKLEELREREDELYDLVEGDVSVRDEPAWLEDAELELVTSVLTDGPRTPNADGDARLAALEREQRRSDEQTVQHAVNRLRNNYMPDAVWASIPERLHPAVRAAIAEARKVEALAANDRRAASQFG